MTRFILDSSVALSWCFKDEQTDESLRLLRLAESASIVVPALWFVEVANILGLAAGKHRLSEAELTLLLELLDALQISVDSEAPPAQFDFLVSFMRFHSLTNYDATYLELALRTGLPLATFDKDLRVAVRKSGLPLV